MIRFVSQKNRRCVILFVHGFTGGEETWRNNKGKYFYEILLENESISDNCDIATFEYFSTLSTLLTGAKSVAGKVFSLFSNSTKKSKKNICVEEISELLRTHIRFTLKSYEHVIVIAHSMGGLITKASILKDYSANEQNKVSLFISLAVPHLGANLANFGKYISFNPQIGDLATLGELIPQLNDQWVKISRKPTIKYFYGTYDDVVAKASAIGTDNIQQDIVSCDEDHTSICKPTDTNSIVAVATRDFITEIINSAANAQLFELQELTDASQFDNEYFVLKLLIADVHQATVKHSKEYFLNAEYARKLFSSSADQKQLALLYEKIRTLYQDSYGLFVNKDGSIKNAGLLVNHIHEKIIAHDSNYLSTALPFIHGLHKKGMLHQLANDLSKDIWWNENQSIQALDQIKPETD